ncbi:MAG: aldehyde dehydrogenase, partial [Myxococcota bacterium]
MEAATPEAHPELAALLETLHDNAPRWLELGPSEILPLLEETRERTLAVAEAWVEASGNAKGLDPDSPLRGEEWSSGPWAVLAGLNGLIFTLGQIAAGNDPLSGMQVRTRPDGQVLVDVFPANVWDQLLLSGYTATVWQKPGVTRDDLREHVAVRFREGQQPPPRVGLVLGAGNINSIPPLDALTELVRLGKTCIVKLNPVDERLERVVEEGLEVVVD